MRVRAVRVCSVRNRFAGFEIAMDDSDGVRFRDGFAGLEHVRDRFFDRERLSVVEHGREISVPAGILHHHVTSARRPWSRRR